MAGLCLNQLFFSKPMAADHPPGCIHSQVLVSGLGPLVLIFLILAAFHYTLKAQQPGENFIAELDELVAESYGPDQHLINGIEYINLHIRSEGHKFLAEDKFYRGRVVIDKKVYKDVFLKYDIFNQQVLLLIQHPSGGNKQIILNNIRIDEFEINGRIFHKYTFPHTGTLFYQVIGNDEMACLYHFKKQEISKPITSTGSLNCMHSRAAGHLSGFSLIISLKYKHLSVKISYGSRS
jgi:hypothetical protein